MIDLIQFLLIALLFGYVLYLKSSVQTAVNQLYNGIRNVDRRQRKR